jgi:integrase/recombinase XerD
MLDITQLITTPQRIKKSRISFFTSDGRDAFYDYLDELNDVNDTCILFPKKIIERAFKESPIIVKDLRKAFSQEGTHRNGESGIKKILMGHSLKSDVNLMHYNYQSEDDLKSIYDRAMKSV